MIFRQPEGTVIAAGEHRILFASKQASTASELHTGFALSKNGEKIFFLFADKSAVGDQAI